MERLCRERPPGQRWGCRAAKLALDGERELTERLAHASYRAVPERVFRLTLDASDWNCPQHITPRFSQHQGAVAVQPGTVGIGALEQQNADLREKLWVLTGD